MVSRLAREYRSAVGDSPPWALLTRWFFALGWLRAATEKLIDPHWWSGAGIESFLNSHANSQLAWYTPFVDRVVIPHLEVVAVVVVLLQIGAGLSLLTGRALGIGLAAGLFLNLSFVAGGAVNPSVFYIVAQGALALWLIESHPSPVARRALVAGVVTLVLLGLASAPLVGTIRPDAVIDDPAVMMLTLAALGTLATIETVRRFNRPAGSPQQRPEQPLPPPRSRDTGPDKMATEAPRQPMESS